MIDSNLETYLRGYHEMGIIDFSLRVCVNAAGELGFYIHPSGRDGITVDCVVSNEGVKLGNVNAPPQQQTN
jgi:hypothetical protein